MGLRLVSGDQSPGGGDAGREVALPPPFPLQKELERRPESVEMAKLYTPLENQESMFKKRHKNLRGRNSGEKCKTCLAL